MKTSTKVTLVITVLVIFATGIVIGFGMGNSESSTIGDRVVITSKLYPEPMDIFHGYNDAGIDCQVNFYGGDMHYLSDGLKAHLPEMCKLYLVSFWFEKDATYVSYWVDRGASKEYDKFAEKNAPLMLEMLKNDGLISYSFEGSNNGKDSRSFGPNVPLEEAYTKAYGSDGVDRVGAIWFKLEP